jgi:dTDP-4-amino-4,6-dideoxygalactose transaminase
MPDPIPLLDLERLHAPIADELRRVFDETLGSGRFILGPAVERFEALLAEKVGTGFALGLSSGTDALLASLMALGVGRGDEVVTTGYSFFATAGAIARLGARPVFADIDPRTFNLDPAAAAAAITDRTVGILPVHLFGQCAEMDRIREIAQRRGLWLVEDAAQALGASFRGRFAGTMGEVAAHSFFPAKNLGALGDAGAITTDDADLAARLRALREHGAEPKFHHARVGGNFRLDALHAALLTVKLPHVDAWESGRRAVAERYRALLGGVEGIALPVEVDGSRHVYNQYVIRVRNGLRDSVRQALTAACIGCAVYYPEPLHLQPCFEPLGYRDGDLPQAEQAAKECLAIPIDPYLDEGDQQRIADALKEALRR